MEVDFHSRRQMEITRRDSITYVLSALRIFNIVGDSDNDDTYKETSVALNGTVKEEDDEAKGYDAFYRCLCR
jgi:hypothetical protein